MTSEAIRLILNKAWENDSWALIFIKDKRKFERQLKNRAFR